MILETLLEAVKHLHPSSVTARVRLTHGELEYDIDSVDYADGVVSFICDEVGMSAYDIGYEEGKREGIEEGRQDANR